MTLPGFHECPECGGDGQCHNPTRYQESDPCSPQTCGNRCRECGGAGQVPDDDTVEVVVREAIDKVRTTHKLGPRILPSEEALRALWVGVPAALLAYARHTQEQT